MGDGMVFGNIPLAECRFWTGLPDRFGVRVPNPPPMERTLRSLIGKQGASGRGRCNNASQETPHICVLPKGHDGPHLGVETRHLARRPHLELASIRRGEPVGAFGRSPE